MTSRQDYSGTPQRQIDYLHRDIIGQNKNVEHFDETVFVYRIYLVLIFSIYRAFFARSEISRIVAQVIVVQTGSSFHFL